MVTRATVADEAARCSAAPGLVWGEIGRASVCGWGVGRWWCGWKWRGVCR